MFRCVLLLVFAAAQFTATAAAAAPPRCLPSDRPSGRVSAEIGRLSVEDQGNGWQYEFVVCQYYDVFEHTGEVSILSNVTGTNWKKADLLAACTPRGSPYGQEDHADKRSITYLGCQDRVEVHVVALDSAKAAQPEKVLVARFGDIDSPPARPFPFPKATPKRTRGECSRSQELGRITVEDEIIGTFDYFACYEPKTGRVGAFRGTKEVGLTGVYRNAVGNVWTKDEVDAARENPERVCGQPGAIYSALGKYDARRLQARLCGGKGTVGLELEAVALDLDFQGKPVQRKAVAVP